MSSYWELVAFGNGGRSICQCRAASQNAPDDMLRTFSELAVKAPDLTRLVLQASVAALVNVQSVDGIEAEVKRRAVVGN